MEQMTEFMTPQDEKRFNELMAECDMWHEKSETQMPYAIAGMIFGMIFALGGLFVTLSSHELAIRMLIVAVGVASATIALALRFLLYIRPNWGRALDEMVEILERY